MIDMSAQQMISVAKAHAAARETLKLSDAAMRIVREPPAPAYSPLVLTGFIRLADWLMIGLSGFLVYAVYVFPTHGFEWIGPIAAISVATIALLVFQMAGLYEWLNLRLSMVMASRLFMAWALAFLVVFAGLFVLKMGQSISRVWIAGWFFGGFAALLMLRALLSYMIMLWTRASMLTRRTVIVGGGQTAEELIAALDAEPDSGVRILGVFDDRDDERSPASTIGVPKLGSVSELIEFARLTRIDLVLVTLPMTAEARVMEMMQKLWVLPVDIRLSAQATKLRFRPRAYSYIGKVPVLDVFDKPMADWDIVLKWLFDKLVGALALIALSPVFLITAIAIKLDSKGPVFFRQKRYGFNNELIEVFKFRSMRTDMADATAAKLVTKDDPRVTRVGKFIRKTSLDELPQLFNVVFFNNLSLVGPRPHAVHAKAANELYHNVVDGYFARHKVKPGITGWAQINGWRGETDTEEKIQRRVEHDLYYSENWSLFFDIYILARTPIALATQRENAY